MFKIGKSVYYRNLCVFCQFFNCLVCKSSCHDDLSHTGSNSCYIGNRFSRSHSDIVRSEVDCVSSQFGDACLHARGDAFSTLARSIQLRTTVIFGPHVDGASRRTILQRFGSLADVEFLDFEPDLAAHYAKADVVVAMAGYNTVCELLSFRRAAVLAPRATPVSEQLLRARLFAARGYFDYVEPHELTPDILIAKVLAALKRPAARRPIDLDGLPRVRERVRSLLADVIA